MVRYSFMDVAIVTMRRPVSYSKKLRTSQVLECVLSIRTDTRRCEITFTGHYIYMTLSIVSSRFAYLPHRKDVCYATCCSLYRY
jgi:hypothetical protein